MGNQRRTFLKQVVAASIVGTGRMVEIAVGAEADRQLPIGDEIFFDHVGHFVPDREAASRALARAGFARTPVSVQVNPDPVGGSPRLTGTGNVTSMLARGYIEILFKTADTPLGRELDGALARYQGVHLAAFVVADAAQAHRRLESSGFHVRPLIQMQRPVDTEIGSGIAAFTVARVEPDIMPEGRIQILTHRTEKTVWQERWLNHPNGAVGLLDLVIAVSDVDEAARRFARFTDRPSVPNSAGQAVVLDRGRIQLSAQREFAVLFPQLPIPSLPFAGAYGIQVKSLDQAEILLRQGKIDYQRDGKQLTARFPDELGTGIWVFVEAASDLTWRR